MPNDSYASPYVGSLQFHLNVNTPLVIAEYLLGLPLLAILTATAYGVIRRRARNYLAK